MRLPLSDWIAEIPLSGIKAPLGNSLLKWNGTVVNADHLR